MLKKSLTKNLENHKIKDSINNHKKLNTLISKKLKDLKISYTLGAIEKFTLDEKLCLNKKLDLAVSLNEKSQKRMQGIKDNHSESDANIGRNNPLDN